MSFRDRKVNTTPVKKAKASTPSRSNTSTSSNNLQNSVRSFIDKEDYDLLPESSSEEIKKANKSVASKERSHYSSANDFALYWKRKTANRIDYLIEHEIAPNKTKIKIGVLDRNKKLDRTKAIDIKGFVPQDDGSIKPEDGYKLDAWMLRYCMTNSIRTLE